MAYRTSLTFSIIFAAFLLVTGCNSYDKLLKSNDISLKYKAAEEFFNKGNYGQAIPLLEDVYKFYIGTAQAETISYDLAYSYYKVGEYSLGAFQFKTFIDGYPLSRYAEDANYYYAYTLFLDSPEKELDQSSTMSAINAFQLFIDKYPTSKRVDDCNKNIDILSNKLQQKAIDNAVLYYNIEQYKAAVWAIRNVLEEYPATKDRERLEYLIVKSAYLYAENSIDEKKLERYSSAVEYYNEMREKLPASKYDPELAEIVKECNHHIQLLSKKKTATSMSNQTPSEVIPRDLRKLETGTANIYESIVIIGKRANQLSLEQKEELHGKLAEFAPSTDNLEEVFENREQIEISTYYEKLPKTTIVATEEFTENKVYHRMPVANAEGSQNA